MLENLRDVWSIIKGRIITDLNLLGVAALLWIVAHQGASVLPLVSLLPAVLQPIAGFALPLVFGVIVQYAVIQTRGITGANLVEANHISTVLEKDVLDLLKSPTLHTVLKQLDEIGKPLVIGAIATEAPILAPAAEAVIEKVEQAAGLADGAEKPAVVAHVPLIVVGPTEAEPATATDAAE